MLKKFLPALLALMFIVSGCAVNNSSNIEEQSTASPEPTSPESTPAVVKPEADLASLLPEDLIQLLNANRDDAAKAADPNALDTVESYQNTGLDSDTDKAIAKQIRQMAGMSNAAVPQSLTHEQIKSELDYLFNLMKYGYAGYGYFGGDTAFNAMKQEMEIALSAMNDPVSTGDYVNRLLVPYLRLIISDGHFTIADSGISVPTCYYTNPGVYFYKDGGQFTTTIDGVKYKLADDDNESRLRPTLDTDGKLAYALGIMLSSRAYFARYNVSLENSQTGETVSKPVVLTRTPLDYYNDLSNDVYTESVYEGIPVLTNRSLSAADSEVLDAFAETGIKARDNPVQILDLRGNAGGSDAYASKWIQNYTGTAPTSSWFYSTTQSTETAHAISDHFGGALLENSTWTQPSLEPWQKLPNKNLLIVLIDGLCMSSGEAFVEYLREVENAIIVGVPTSGCLQFANVGGTSLPESSLYVQFGATLSVPKDLSTYEDNGFAPDLWVAPGESLDRVVKFVQQLQK